MVLNAQFLASLLSKKRPTTILNFFGQYLPVHFKLE